MLTNSFRLREQEWLLLMALLIWQAEVHRNMLEEHSTDHFPLKKEPSQILTCLSTAFKPPLFQTAELKLACRVMDPTFIKKIQYKIIYCSRLQWN